MFTEELSPRMPTTLGSMVEMSRACDSKIAVSDRGAVWNPVKHVTGDSDTVSVKLGIMPVPKTKL